MARKKQEIALQVEIESQEEWEDMLAKEGMTVVDVYQEWCGPCASIVSQFRRLKNELSDDLLRFAAAKADTVDALEKYRGKSQPCFLFFAGGALVCVIRGANAPLLMKSITEQLSQEHKVLDGQSERKEIHDPLLAELEDKEKASAEDDDDEDELEPVKKEVTVAIIKPDVVAAGKVDEVMEKIKEAGIEILQDQERTLTEDEAKEFYSHLAESEMFEDVIKMMTSGPSHVLVLTKGNTGENIVQEWRDMLGPANVEEAKESAPDSLRALYGSEKHVNALHGSDSTETAMRELGYFFPDYAVPIVPGTGPKPKIQRTLALIRPDALREKKDDILAKIAEAGFTVALQKEVQLTKEQAEEFYKEHKEESYFEELTNRMTSGPMLALGLAREDAVQGWRDMLGPKEVDKAKEEAPESLRAQFSVEDVPINQLHGSDSPDTAQQELNYFFPMQQTVAVIKPDAFQTKDEIMDRIREAGFHIAARKETELTKDIVSDLYKENTDKEYFGDLTDHMCSGPTLFMVLSREDAVDGWRSLMGPTDPEKAKEEQPDSIRAQFGSDVKSNAVHGSSKPEDAQLIIKEVFGDLEFNADGTLVEEKTTEQESEQQQEAEAAPTEGAPAEAAPTEGAPAESAPTEGAPAEEAPGEEAPAESAPTEQAPAEGEEKKEETTEEQKEGEGEAPKEGEETQETQATEEGGEQKTEEQAQPEGEKTEEQTEEPKTEEAPKAEEEQKEGEGEKAEEKPAEGEQAPEAEQKPEETEQKAEETEQKPEEAEQKPEETEQKAEEGEQKEEQQEQAAEGEQKEETPAEEAKPEEGGEQKTEEEAKPEGEKTEEQTTEEAPKEGEKSEEQKEGDATPQPKE